MQGNTKNTPGPRGPPLLKTGVLRQEVLIKMYQAYLNLPIRNITARSNSATTLKHTNSENGMVNIINSMEKILAKTSINPALSSSAATTLTKHYIINKIFDCTTIIQYTPIEKIIRDNIVSFIYSIFIFTK